MTTNPEVIATRAKAFARKLRQRYARANPPERQPPDLTSTTSMYWWLNDDKGHARPEYLWGTLHAARVAKALGHGSVTTVEFGVAGGNGLLALESAAAASEKLLDVNVRVVGFDSGIGMPPPQDERDIPWAIQPGILPMNEEALRGRLTRAELIVGDVRDTVVHWIDTHEGIVGFVSFDLDMYSSTIEAFRLLDAPATKLLPRVACYFDDIFGYAWNEYTGERAAIHDFNESHNRRKIAQMYGLQYELPRSERMKPWPEQIYLAHIFDSDAYNLTEWQIPEAWISAHELRDES